ncbi:hypothetical protein B484DRAFT_451598 [Ochromonadaceae sp. CCMP2298]|nr:hypothetical protein B484DRAFT_451598 [Ochromonadaceae sp. CCMP2298]
MVLLPLLLLLLVLLPLLLPLPLSPPCSFPPPLPLLASLRHPHLYQYLRLHQLLLRLRPDLPHPLYQHSPHSPQPSPCLPRPACP